MQNNENAGPASKRVTTTSWDILSDLMPHQKEFLRKLGKLTKSSRKTGFKLIEACEILQMTKVIWLSGLVRGGSASGVYNSYLTKSFGKYFEDGKGVSEAFIMALVTLGWLKIYPDRYEWIKKTPITMRDDKHELSDLIDFTNAYIKQGTIDKLVYFGSMKHLAGMILEADRKANNWTVDQQNEYYDKLIAQEEAAKGLKVNEEQE